MGHDPGRFELMVPERSRAARRGPCRALGAVLAFACLLMPPGTARGDDFADFRIPTHRVISWTGSSNGWWRGSTGDFGTSRARSGDFSGNIGSDLRRLTDGEAGFTDLIVSGFLDGDRSSNRFSGYDQTPLIARGFDQQASARRTGEEGDVRCRFGRYAGGAPIVLGAEARAAGNLRQDWGKLRDASSAADNVSRAEDWTERDGRGRRSFIIASLRPRIGFGRVRDASGVYIARAMEERLRRDGVLARALSHEARQKLADLLTLRDEYNRLHARPAKGLWGEVARVLGDDGALAPGGLDASSTQHAGEPLLDAETFGFRADGLPGTLVLRERGASASAFVSGTHQRRTSFDEFSQRSQATIDGVPQPIVSYSFSDRSVTTLDGIDAGLEAEWHRPVGLRVQVDASAEASVPVRPQDDGLAARIDGQASWMVADRWLVQGSVTQQRDLLQDAKDRRTRQDDWASLLNGLIAYEVEDHVTIQLRVQDSQRGARTPARGPQVLRSYQHLTEITLGLTYRFAGRYSAPGFVALSRMTRPAAGI